MKKIVGKNIYPLLIAKRPNNCILGCAGAGQEFIRGILKRNMCDTESTAKWLLNRYISELKNLFDKRYKNHINLNEVFQIKLIENPVSAPTDTWTIYDSSESINGLYHIGGTL